MNRSELPMLVLLPGMDGTGQLFSPLVSALGPDVETIIVRYPCDIPLSYEELEAIDLAGSILHSKLAHSTGSGDHPSHALGDALTAEISS